MSKRKQIWFNLGVSALQRILPEFSGSYICPLCLNSFSQTEIQHLTFEHVPPRSLKGRELVLTCSDCNKHASGKSGVDTHAKKRENVFDFALGTMSSPHRARYTLNNISQEVRVVRSGNGMLIVGVPKANPPNRGQEIQQELESTTPNEQPTSMSISLYRDTYSQRNAAISYLRAGYLAAFAAFGYRYILGPAFNLVRDQIAKPKENIIATFSMIVPEAEPSARNIALATDPSWLYALAIQMERHIVFLPINSGDQTFYDVLQAQSEQSPRLSLKATPVFRWPKAPEFVCDFDLRAKAT